MLSTYVSSRWTFALALDSLGAMPARAAIIRCREMGYAGVGISAARKDFAPRVLGDSGVRDLRAFLGKNDLSAALVSTGGRAILAVPAMLQEDIDRCVEGIGLASALRSSAAVRVGPLGSPDSPAAANLKEALAVLSDAADRAGVMLALEASNSEQGILDTILAGFPGAPVGRLFDPGAALFVGRDPVAEASGAGAIAAVMASDASADAASLAPGEGRVSWRETLAALAARGYHSAVTVRFQARGDAGARAAEALEALRRASV